MVERRFITIEESKVPELKQLKRCDEFDYQSVEGDVCWEAERLEQLRRQPTPIRFLDSINRSNFPISAANHCGGRECSARKSCLMRINGLIKANRILGRVKPIPY